MKAFSASWRSQRPGFARACACSWFDAACGLGREARMAAGLGFTLAGLRLWIGYCRDPSCYKKSTFFLTDGQPSFMIRSPLDERTARRLRRTLTRQLRRVRRPAARSIGRPQARIRMDEDKRRERDRQLPGLASAKRILAQEDRSLGGATHVRPTVRSAIFLPSFARKPLIILDSGKRTEIL
jgi:hypothetical protein